jgi:hypothetical protein
MHVMTLALGRRPLSGHHGMLRLEVVPLARICAATPAAEAVHGDEARVAAARILPILSSPVGLGRSTLSRESCFRVSRTDAQPCDVAGKLCTLS